MFITMLTALIKGNVKFVVVGGFAFVLQGHARLTMGLDIVIALDEQNAKSAISALKDLGLVPRLPVDPFSFAIQETRESWIQTKNLMVFSMIDPKNPLIAVDLFVDPPIEFDLLFMNADHLDAGGVTVPVCSINDLIAMKMLSGRPEDLSDISALEEIKNARSE